MIINDTVADLRRHYRGWVVAVGGSPHSGKSVFIAELYRQLLARRSSDYVFLQRACPDYEGMWSNEANPEIVQRIRKKGEFSEEFVLFTLTSISSLARKFPLVLLDLGGKRTAENAEILQRSTHLIILSSLKLDVEAWQTFSEAEGCKTIARLHSQLIKNPDGSLDETARSSLHRFTYPVQGTLVNLSRETSKQPYIQAIQHFAEWLLEQC